MNIPALLEDKLKDKDLGPLVRVIFGKFNDWMDDNTKGLYFFPEYTDHGPKHIAAVLESSVALITEEARDILTTEDAAVLVLATLLHDSAMHLTRDGFLRLLSPDRKRIIEELDKESWLTLFDRYYSEATRWDDRTLYRVLGDQAKASGEEDLHTVIRPVKEMQDSEKWNVKDQKYLGEFVRRHHARLAHEIARWGYPAAQEKTRLTLGEVPEHLADIAGFVARSHNMPLRATLDYLNKKYKGAVSYRNIHPVFLGALLRIADYLELKANRVNETSLEIQRLRSPISQAEWNAHLAIEDAKPDDNDKESIFIIAEPKSASEFIKLKSTLANLQAELDATWAVLGEVYSLRKPLDAFGITLRRVRSNLDDTEEFVRTSKPNYFPMAARFETAGASLLKLLIRPLYADSPEIGVRELLQNALDAVHELSRYCENHPKVEVKLREQEADVLITVEHKPDGNFLTISDRGIGMSAEIVRDYFLKAGASYRDSRAWLNEFGVENKSKVLRSGRFGIGSLAAFLLGPRLEVWTRRVDAPEGDAVHFTASISDDQVEIKREARADVGTVIIIKLTNEAAEVLSQMTSSDPEDSDFVAGWLWDWYTLDEPKVERWVNKTELKQQRHFPAGRPLDKDTDWRLITHPDYDAIHWNYFLGRTQLVCNGIDVRGAPGLRVPRRRLGRFGSPQIWNYPHAPFETPTVSLFDPDGNLPLTLRRDRLEGREAPFANQLLADVTRDYCAFLLVHGPRSVNEMLAFEQGDLTIPKETEQPEWKAPLPYFSRVDHVADLDSGTFWSTNVGSVLWHPWHLRALGMRRVFGIIARNPKSPDITDLINSFPEAAVLVGASDWVEVPTLLMGNSDDDMDESTWFKPIAGRVLLNGLAGLTEDDVTLPDEDDSEIPGNDLFWERGRFDNGPEGLRKLHSFARKKESKNIVAFVEYQFDPEKFTRHGSAFEGFWSKIMKHPILPFSMEERRKQFAAAFEELKDYIKVWELPEPPGWRGQMLAELRARIDRLNR
jgi:molecular chaperone HtpG